MNYDANTPWNSNLTGSFRMFRDDPTPSIWLTAFVGRTLQEARFGEWERDLFIPLELINTVVLWMCAQQNETGAFYPNSAPVYDRVFVSIYINFMTVAKCESLYSQVFAQYEYFCVNVPITRF
jgi:hypothetical protein